MVENTLSFESLFHNSPPSVLCVFKTAFMFYACVSLVLFISNNSLYLKNATFEYVGVGGNSLCF